jgi:YVTN family beta-propeller protein
MEHQRQDGKHDGSLFSLCRRAALLSSLLLAACGTGGDSGSEPNTPLSTPMALVVNQDDTTLTTLRLDGKNSPVISTLSLGPAQPDAIGGVAFSLGEWIFVTHTAQNRVATIDPIGATTPILEGFLTENPLDTRVKIGQRPTRIYRDPVDKEVLWTMNDGDAVTGIDTLANCAHGGSVSVLHNSHLGVGGEKPRVTSIVCLSGKGEHFIEFSRPPVTPQEVAFVSSKTTGLISVLLPVPTAGGSVAWSEFFVKIDLCDNVKETSLGHPACDGTTTTPNHSAPAGMFWSQATGKIYSYLSGYGVVVEIDPGQLVITRTVAISPRGNIEYRSVGMTPDGRFLFLAGEDVISDAIANPSNSKVLGSFGAVRLDTPSPADPLTVTDFSIPQLDNIRPSQFQFAPDGRRLYVTQSNKVSDLAFAAQAHSLKVDKLLVFDPSTFPAAPTFVAEIDLPAVGPSGFHGMDLWITGPHGAGAAKGVVATNATPGVNGTVSLIDASTNAIAATIPVGRNPKQVTVYYFGLAASDNQATPIW